MIMTNENKKLSQNRKRGIERRMKIDDKMKSLIKKIKKGKNLKTLIKLKI